MIGVVVVVIVVILVLALFLTGVLPGLKSSGSSSSSSPASFDSAQSTASNNAANRGGSWTVVAALGVDSVVPLAVPSDLGALFGLSCKVTNTSSSPPSVPANTGAYATGDQSGWVFFLYQSSSSTLLLSLVIGSSVTTLGTIVGSSCFTAFGQFTGSAGAIDSPAVTQAVATDAASFTSAYSSASSSLLFVSGSSITVDGHTITTAPSWDVMYTNCSFDATSGTGAQYTASVNGTSGAVTVNGGTNTIACTSLTLAPPVQQTEPFGDNFAMGSPVLTTVSPTGAGVGCATPTAGTEYCYDLTIEGASAGLTLSSVGLEVRTSSGATFAVKGISIASFLSSTGAGSTTLPATCAGPVCNDGSSSTPWTYGTTGVCTGPPACGPSTQLSTTMMIILDMGTTSPAGQGYVCVALGQAPYAGTVSTSLP